MSKTGDLEMAERADDTGLDLFTGEPQHERFPRLGERFATRAMAAARTPFELPDGAAAELPQRYAFQGEKHETAEFLDATDTVALLVLKDGAVRYERYWLTGGRDVPWISWSVAKSFVSALMGIAVEEGAIASIEDPMERYVSAYAESDYAGIRIKDVLQMSSGMRWNEDYSDPDADIHRFGSAMAPGGSLQEFTMGMVRENAPGTVCKYCSADTQALGAVLVAATGRPIAEYMHEKLVEPLGFEHAGYWLTDSRGMEMAAGGVNLVARDYAKFGELFRNDGVWAGRQIVPADWVKASVTPDAPHLMPNATVVDNHPFPLGYGYQWWIPDGDRGEFAAIGIYNQFVYVDPSREVVIVKQSANRAYGTTPDESSYREVETIELLRSIAASLD